MGRFSNSNNKRGQRRMVAANKPPKERPQGECLFDRLPAELVGVILSFVPPTNLPSVLRVCHTWHAVLQSDEPLWRRWCAQLLDKRLVEMREQPTWRAHFRQCVEKYSVMVYNLGYVPVEMRFGGRQTLEDVVRQIYDREPTARRSPSLTLQVHLKRDGGGGDNDGEWVMLAPSTPLFVHGLRRAGQRMSCSQTGADLDLDFHNLDRHTDEELREACWSLGVSGYHRPSLDWSRTKLIRSLSGKAGSKPSQFESPYVDFY